MQNSLTIASLTLFTTSLFFYFLFSSSEIMVDICLMHIMHSYNYTGIPLRTNIQLQQITQSLEIHVLLPDCLQTVLGCFMIFFCLFRLFTMWVCALLYGMSQNWKTVIYFQGMEPPILLVSEVLAASRHIF